MVNEKIRVRVSGINKDILLVYLYLPAKKYKKFRKIGELNLEKKIFYSTPRISSKHLMRCNNSLGICYKLISEYSKYIKYICIPLDKKKLWVRKRKLRELGTFLHFQQNNLEKQIFLNLNAFSNSKKRAKVE